MCILSPNHVGEKGSHILFCAIQRHSHNRLPCGHLGCSCAWGNNHVRPFLIISLLDKLPCFVNRPSNPGYTIDELVHQLNATKSVLIFTHSMFLDSAYSAAKRAGISNDRVVLLDAITKSSTFTSLSEIVSLGANKPENYTAQRYQPGEGKTRLAFLSFSSGTTGEETSKKWRTFSLFL